MLYIDSERTVALGGVIASDALCSDQVPPPSSLPTPPSSPPLTAHPPPSTGGSTGTPTHHRAADRAPIPGCEELLASAVADGHYDVRRALR